MKNGIQKIRECGFKDVVTGNVYMITVIKYCTNIAQITCLSAIFKTLIMLTISKWNDYSYFVSA